MKMFRYIVRRIIISSIVILFAGLGLVRWRGRFDVKREERSAANEVRLFEYLYALENGPALIESLAGNILFCVGCGATGHDFDCARRGRSLFSPNDCGRHCRAVPTHA